MNDTQQGLAGSEFTIDPLERGLPAEQALNRSANTMADFTLADTVAPMYEAKAKILAEAAANKRLAINGKPPAQQLPNGMTQEEYDSITGSLYDTGSTSDSNAIDAFQYGAGKLLGDTVDVIGDAGSRGVKDLYKLYNNVDEEQANKELYAKTPDMLKDWFDKDMNFIGADALDNPETYGYDPTIVQGVMQNMGNAYESGNIVNMAKSVVDAFVEGGPNLLAESAIHMAATRNPYTRLLTILAMANTNMEEVQKNLGKKDIGYLRRATSLSAAAFNMYLEKAGVDAIIGKSNITQKIIGNIIATKPKSVALTSVQAITKQATKVAGVAGYEGLTELAQNTIEAFNNKYGTTKEKELYDGTLGKDNFAAFGAGAATAGLMRTPDSIIRTVASPITGSVGNQARLNKKFDNAAKNAKMGFNTKEDKQKYTDLVNDNINTTEEAAADYDTIEEMANGIGESTSDPLSAINALQPLVTKRQEADNQGAVEAIINFGSKEVQSLYELIGSNEGLRDRLNDEFVEKLSKSSAIESVSQMGQFLSENVDILNDETKQAYNDIKDSLTTQAKTLVDSGGLELSYDTARNSATVNKNLQEHIKKTVSKQVDPKTDTTLSTETVKSKPAGLLSKLGNLGRDAKLEDELSKYSGETLKALGKEATKAINTTRKNADAGLKGQFKANAEAKKAKAILAAVNKLTSVRKTLKKSYTPKKSIKETVTDYVSEKLDKLKQASDEIKEEQVQDNTAPNTGDTKEDTRTKEEKRKAKNRKTPAEKKALRAQMRKDALKVTKEVEQNIDEITLEDIPIIEEILDGVNTISESTKKYVDKVRAKLTKKAKELKLKKDEADIVGKFNEMAKNTGVRKSVATLVSKMLDKSKTATRADAKVALETLGKQLNSKLTLSEKYFIAKAIGKALSAGKFTSKYATKYVDKLTSAYNSKTDGITEEEFKANISKTIGSIYMDSKILAKKVIKALRTKNGRQKIEAALDSKIDSALNGQLGEDISKFIANDLTYTEQAFLQGLITGSNTIIDGTVDKSTDILNKIIEGIDFKDSELTKKELLDVVVEKFKLKYRDIKDAIKDAGTREGRQDLQNKADAKLSDMVNSELGKEFTKDYNSIIQLLTQKGRDSKALALKEFKQFKQKYKDTTPLEVYINIKEMFQSSDDKVSTSEVVDTINEEDINLKGPC